MLTEEPCKFSFAVAAFGAQHQPHGLAAHLLQRDLERAGAATWRRLAERAEAETARRIRQATPPEQLWLGLERYWRRRETG